LLLTIEKQIYGGDGLAHLPADERGRGKAAFVPYVLTGEKVEVETSEQKPGFARAIATQVVEASAHRVPPQCPYFIRCGGCHYQHADYQHQLDIKKEILRESLRRIAKLDLQCPIQVHPSPPWNYRNRSRLQLRAAPEFCAGYFKMRSHEVLEVEQCPISSPLINRGIATLWQLGRAGKVPRGVHEVEFFADAEDSRLLVELSCASDARRPAVRDCAEQLRAAMPTISGVVAFRTLEKGGHEKLLVLGESALSYRSQSAAYRVSAGGFFQANRFLIDELVRTVTEQRSCDLALDLYAGVGLFSTALACNFRHIISVESSQTSVADLSYNLPSNGKAVQATVEQFLGQIGRGGKTSLSGSGRQPDLVVPDLLIMDPPRSGVGERVARSLVQLGAQRLTYVSCDPATLARDLLPLLAADYSVEQAHLFDLFPQTYHLESVLHLVR
jgi:23S rRNA (uracil1939-C5)-methyltransferase